jgi:flagellar motor protein MotB
MSENLTPQMTDNNQAPVRPASPPAGAAPDVPQSAAPAMPTGSAPEAPQKPGTFFHNTSHAFMGAVLGALAGKKESTYKVDNNPDSPTYGQTLATNQDMSHGDQLKKIAASALQGLAAGSQVQTRKSGAASGLAGFGAGAGAVMDKNKEQDELKRKQAGDDFEQQQRAIIQKSNVAHLNANTMATYFGNIKAGNDLNPEFAQNHSIVDAINDSPELGHAKVMSSEDVENLRSSDDHFMADNVVLPLGRVPKLDEQGNPVLDPKTKQPLTTFQIAVIPGHDGNLIVPKSLADDVQKYGERAGISNSEAFTEGSQIPFKKIIPAMAAIGAEKKAELAGWQKAEDVLASDNSTHLQMNPVTGETRPYPKGVQPNVENKALKGTPGAALTKIETDPSETAGDKAPAVMAMAQEQLANPATSPADRIRWQRVSNQAQIASNIEQNQKAAIAKTAEAQKDGNPDDAAKLLVAGVSAPAQMLSTRKPEFVTEVLKRAHEMDPHWNAEVADAQFNTAKSPTNLAFFGSAKSIIDPGGSADQVIAAGKLLPQGQYPVLNTYADWLAAAQGSTPLAHYAASVLGFADDYAKVMGGGTGSDTARDQALHLAPPSANQQAREGAIEGARDGVNSQGVGRIGSNRIMKNMYGDTFKFPTAGPAGNNPPPGTHAVGDTIMQNGHEYTVSAIDSNGKVIGATPKGAN